MLLTLHFSFTEGIFLFVAMRSDYFVFGFFCQFLLVWTLVLDQKRESFACLWWTESNGVGKTFHVEINLQWPPSERLISGVIIIISVWPCIYNLCRCISGRAVFLPDWCSSDELRVMWSLNDIAHSLASAWFRFVNVFWSGEDLWDLHTCVRESGRHWQQT